MLDGISRLLHREQRKLLWASLKCALEAEAADAGGDAAHALVQKMVSCAASESAGTQELAAMLLAMYLEAVESSRSKARGEVLTCLTRPWQTGSGKGRGCDCMRSLGQTHIAPDCSLSTLHLEALLSWDQKKDCSAWVKFNTHQAAARGRGTATCHQSMIALLGLQGLHLSS